MNDKETLIVKNLFEHEEFSKKVVPFLKVGYFDDPGAKAIVKNFVEYVDKYTKIPNYETMLIVLGDDKKNLDSPAAVKCLEELKDKPKVDFQLEFLIKEAEMYFQWHSLSKAVMKSAEMLGMPDNEEKHKIRSIVPEMLREALKLSFNNNTGREFLTDKEIEDQYMYYHNAERKYPLPRWKYMTQMLRGGMSRKKLHLFMSGTNVGKTAWMINIAEQYVISGLDVLYITLEIAEEEIIERIDANILSTDTDKLIYIPKQDYVEKLTDIKKNNAGRLFVKEFPPASISVTDIRLLLDELKIKHAFSPLVLIVDYLNLMKSVRFKNASDSYSYVKGITEEIRGLAVEKELITISATQTNRGQINSSDPGMDGISDSIGVAFTADWVCALIETPDAKANNQQMVKQLKSRYAPIYPTNERWIVKIDKDQQRITELNDYTSNEARGFSSSTATPVSDNDRVKKYKARTEKSSEEKIDLKIEPKKDYQMPHIEALNNNKKEERVITKDMSGFTF